MAAFMKYVFAGLSSWGITQAKDDPVTAGMFPVRILPLLAHASVHALDLPRHALFIWCSVQLSLLAVW